MSVLEREPGEDMLRVLDDDGGVVGDVPDLTDDEFVEMYRYMKLARHFDERAVSLNRQGRMGTYPPLSGQEGAQIGSAMAMADDDWLIPSYREHAAAVVRGLPLRNTLLYWMGDERGATAEDANVFTPAVPIASQIPHATGMAWAHKLQDDEVDRAFVCHFGDGATSEGDFHEGLNFAGVFDTPTVFFCNNNQWAISVPRERQTASETLAQKARAYGFEGVQVDGMDPLAVYQVTREAREKAIDPAEGQARPTMIEAVQYRFGAHTTADDPSVYREDEEVERWRAKDPIPRLESFLRDQGVLDDDRVEAIEESVREAVADAIDAAESYPDPDPQSMFENVYAEQTPELARQAEQFAELRERFGDDAFLEE
ncbi:MAG: pyruvate dehydrogenase (acetyl-transferring) E1 component subunit alpha [Halobaculum sp.]